MARVKREFREQVGAALSPQAGQPNAKPKLAIEEGARVKVKGVREVARVRRLLSNDAVESKPAF